MKHLLFLLVLTLSINTTNAQDATLQETIDWLNIYGFEDNFSDVNKRKTKVECDVSLNKNGVASFYFIYFEMSKDDSDWREREYDNYERFSILQVKFIYLYPPIGNRQGYTIRIGVQNKDISLFVEFPDKEKAISLFKALKHLNTFYSHEIQFIDKIRPDLKNKF
ncbi:hypothetical protein [Tenacibaculum aestuarii]|uniref:hypothetical protein n=1 Tax=Tenacibaculum aestuarii TaxID=362781 RepID=UPI0038942ED4